MKFSLKTGPNGVEVQVGREVIPADRIVSIQLGVGRDQQGQMALPAVTLVYVPSEIEIDAATAAVTQLEQPAPPAPPAPPTPPAPPAPNREQRRAAEKVKPKGKK